MYDYYDDLNGYYDEDNSYSIGSRGYGTPTSDFWERQKEIQKSEIGKKLDNHLWNVKEQNDYVDLSDQQFDEVANIPEFKEVFDSLPGFYEYLKSLYCGDTYEGTTQDKISQFLTSYKGTLFRHDVDVKIIRSNSSISKEDLTIIIQNHKRQRDFEKVPELWKYFLNLTPNNRRN